MTLLATLLSCNAPPGENTPIQEGAPTSASQAQSARGPIAADATSDSLCGVELDRDLDELSEALRVVADRADTSSGVPMVEGVIRRIHDRARISSREDIADQALELVRELDGLTDDYDTRVAWIQEASDLVVEVLKLCIPSEQERAEDRQAWLAERGVSDDSAAEAEPSGAGEGQHDWAFDDAYERAFIRAISETNRLRNEVHEIGTSSGMPAAADAMEEQLSQVRELIDQFAERTPPETWAAANDHILAGLSMLEMGWQESIDAIRTDDLLGQQRAARTIEGALDALADAVEAAP
jgi:hypothetical protein